MSLFNYEDHCQLVSLIQEYKLHLYVWNKHLMAFNQWSIEKIKMSSVICQVKLCINLIFIPTFTSSAFILCIWLFCLWSNSLLFSSALSFSSFSFAINLSIFFFFSRSWRVLCMRILSASILLTRFWRSRSCCSSNWRWSSSEAPCDFSLSTSSCWQIQTNTKWVKTRIIYLYFTFFGDWVWFLIDFIKNYSVQVHVFHTDVFLYIFSLSVHGLSAHGHKSSLGVKVVLNV